jgi:hypothetical protein
MEMIRELKMKPSQALGLCLDLMRKVDPEELANEFHDLVREVRPEEWAVEELLERLLDMLAEVRERAGDCSAGLLGLPRSR